MDQAAFEDVRLAPAHEAILGTSAALQEASTGTAVSAGDAANIDATDLYADLDLPANTDDLPDFAADHSARLVSDPEQTDSAPSALLQRAMQMLASAQHEEQNLAAESAAAYSRLAEAQAASKKQHIAFEGYCCLPEMQSKQWYWLEKGQQQGPHSIADLFKMSRVHNTVSPHQEIHNYYEEVSTHIRYKLQQHRGLSSAWQSVQQALTDVQSAEAAVVQALLEVKAGKGHTAAAKAGLNAVQATEARWDWTPLDPPLDPSPALDSNLGSTPSELQELIATGQLVASQHVFPISQAGVPRQAGEVVSEWQDALAYCQHMAAGQAQDSAVQTAQAAAAAPTQESGLDPADACWAYWDGQQQQGPFPLQDLQAWVHAGHFIASMQVYHITDPTIAYTLEQLFAQLTPQPPTQLSAPSSSQTALTHQAPAATLSLPLRHQTDDQPHMAALTHPAVATTGHVAGPGLTSPSRMTGPASSSANFLSQPYRQQQDLTAQAKLIAEKLRQELLESGKRAVYQLMMKNIREALPGIQQAAQQRREAAAAQEAAEAEVLQAEAEAAAQLAAEQAAAEAARLKAEARARKAAARAERQRREAEALAKWEQEQEEERVAAEAAAAAAREQRELVRQEAKRRRDEEERERQAIAAQAAAEAEAARQAEVAAQRAWQEEHLKRKLLAAAKAAAAAEAAAQEEADRKTAADKAAAEKAAAEAAEKAAAKQAAAEKVKAEREAKAAAKKAVLAAAAEKAAAERAVAKQAAQAAAEKEAAEQAAAEAAAEQQAAEERAAAQQVRELAAKMAAEREAQQAAEAAERQAALRAKRVAQAQAMQKQRQAKLAADKARQAQATEKAKQTRLDRAAEKAAAAAAGRAADDISENGDGDADVLHSNALAEQLPNGHAQHLGALPLGSHCHTNGLVSAAQKQEGLARDLHRDDQTQQLEHGEVAGNGLLRLDNDVDLMLAPMQGLEAQNHQQPDARAVASNIGAGGKPQSRSLQAVLQQPSATDTSALALLQSSAGGQTRYAPAVAQAEDDFDWAAWQDDVGSGIVERLATRERRPPKRPYNADEEQPKPKTKMGSKGPHERSLPKHVREISPAVSTQHSSQLKRQPSKRRKLQHEAGCIRAVPYQSEAFLAARMAAFQQQGLLQGNVPSAGGDSHQVAPHVVRVVGGKQRQQRSAVRNISRQEAVTDASWGLLKGRTQDLRFGRSRVHAWGLFAKQDIEPEQFMIEYVGQIIRTSLLDLREKAYERSGLGSSYLFRIDESWAVDATRHGGLARFINHSCEPNCYTKIITVEGQKHIVIYSKHHIHAGEELTYDYKFEYELTAEPIKCTCGASNCRGRLN